MQYLKITPTFTLQELNKRVGSRNVSSILHLNNLSRSFNIGKQYAELCKSVQSIKTNVSWERKAAVLNTMTKDSDIFETAALASEDDWQIISNLNSFNNMLQIPEKLELPAASDILGNRIPISSLVYRNVMDSLKANREVDPAIFNKYSTIKDAQIQSTYSSPLAFQWFNIPWGEITLYSSLDGVSKDIPVYPNELSDEVRSNYTQMPDMLYQYEPWQVYTSSGPRTCPLTFEFHRDMWTGDHRDGKANELIRFMEAQCYPEYDGSAVYSSITTLFIHGRPFVSGVVTDVSTTWDGPLGLDGWYLHCTVTITFTEVATSPLNYTKIKNKPLIG